MDKKPTSISKIVSAVYCEQKAVYDEDFGVLKDLTDKNQAMLHKKALHGTATHRDFEYRGKKILTQGGRETDKRCFIATCVYGQDAVETVWLRLWRDNFFLKHRLGRFFVKAYYVVSPTIVHVIEKHPSRVKQTRDLLNRVLIMIGYPQ